MTDSLKVLKKRLINEDKIGILLEEIGCELIKEEQGGSLITARLPDKFHSNNPRAVQCRLNDGLTCSIRNRPDFRGDIFSLISYINHDKRGDDINKDLYESKKFICRELGWNEFMNGSSFEKKVDYLSKLKKMKRKTRQVPTIKPNPVINKSIMNNFILNPVKPWLDEGISYRTQLEYNVGFDLLTKRIVFPIRNRFGDIVGVKGRLIENKDVSDFNPKYNYLYRCNISQEWFNLDRALPSIKEKKEVIIFESEKSVMKMHSNGIYNCLAISSSDISDVQASIICSLGYDIKIVLAYDNDKDSDEISHQAEKFDKREVFAIFDNEGMLGEKDSPIDKGIDVWYNLYRNKKFQVTWVYEEDEIDGMD